MNTQTSMSRKKVAFSQLKIPAPPHIAFFSEAMATLFPSKNISRLFKSAPQWRTTQLT